MFPCSFGHHCFLQCSLLEPLVMEIIMPNETGSVIRFLQLCSTTEKSSFSSPDAALAAQGHGFSSNNMLNAVFSIQSKESWSLHALSHLPKIILLLLHPQLFPPNPSQFTNWFPQHQNDRHFDGVPSNLKTGIPTFSRYSIDISSPRFSYSSHFTGDSTNSNF